MKYANTEINFTPERLVELLQYAIDGLRIDDEYSAMEYFRDTMNMTDYEREFFGIPQEEEYEEEEEEEYFSDDYDGSDIGCKDCPDDECTGHCMSCPYRPI